MTLILRVGLQQAIRSLTLILLPIAFIALVAWATAGSSSGNTADPLRAALWFFLVAHQVPLQLNLSDATSSGSLTFLPLGALVIPFLALRSGYRRMVETLGQPNHRERRSYILSFATSYSILGYLITVPALGGTVAVPFYIAIPILLVVSSITTFLTSGALPKHELQFPWQRALRVIWISLVTMIGLGSLILAASLTFHFQLVVDLTQVVEPGVFGGLVLLLGQILYLPNMALASLAYVSGSGISIGEGTLLNPIVHRIDEIPAIPVLGAIPASGRGFALLLAIPVIILGSFIAKYGAQTYSDFTETKRFYLAAIAISLALLLLVARVTSGQLLSANLPSVGPIWWALPIVVTTQLALGGLLYIYVPKLITSIRMRNALK